MLVSSQRLFVVLMLCGLSISSGCYLDYPDHTGTAEVQGTVFLDGLPVNQAMVVFMPADLRAGYDEIIPFAFGLTDANGEFSMIYRDKSRDIQAANYAVIVSQVLAQKDPAGQALGKWPMGLLPEVTSQIDTIDNVKDTIPDIYNRQTILRYEVKPSPKILKPVFQLTSVDPRLLESSKPLILDRE